MDIKEIPLDQILEPEVPVRSVADDEKMQELVVSVDRVGLLQPLVVRPEGEKFRIVAGHRRYIALRAMGAGTAPCSVVEVGAGEAALMSLAENLAREDIDPVDEAKYFQYLVSSLGLTHDDIAGRIGKHRTYVTKRLMLLRLDEDTKDDITYRELAPSTALELGRVPDKPTRDYLRTTAVKGGASTAVVRTWVEDALSRPQEVDAGDFTVDPEFQPPASTYTPPTCFICGRSLDEGGLQNVWVCAWELAGLKKGMEGGE